MLGLFSAEALTVVGMRLQSIMSVMSFLVIDIDFLLKNMKQYAN